MSFDSILETKKTRDGLISMNPKQLNEISTFAHLSKDDQNRIMTPHEAIDNGASKLVIGRSISKAIDPNKAIIEIFKSIDSD